MARHKARGETRNPRGIRSTDSLPVYLLNRWHCTACNKVAYPTRRNAKRAAKRLHTGEQHISVYPCPDNAGYHVGHNTLWLRERATFLRRTGGVA